MNTNITIDDGDLWDAVAGYVEDTINDKLTEYVHDDDLECEVASYIEDKEVVTADMICDVTEFMNRIDELEKNSQKMMDNEKFMWAAIKDLQSNHNHWSGENAKIRDENSELREHIDYLFVRVNDLESRTLRGRWDRLTDWVRSKFNA